MSIAASIVQVLIQVCYHRIFDSHLMRWLFSCLNRTETMKKGRLAVMLEKWFMREVV